MPAMKRRQFLNVHIRDAVSIRQHEGLLADKVAQAFHTAASIGMETGVDQMDDPVFRTKLPPHDVPGTELHREAAIQQGIINEIAFGDFTLVAQRDDEFPKAEMSVL